MSRSGKIIKRKVAPDQIHGKELITRLVNRVMQSGKKTLAQRIVYGALEIIASKSSDDPLSLVEGAIRTVAPRMEVRPRRVGGASYQVPSEVRGDRRDALAIRWILDAASKRPSREIVKELSAPERAKHPLAAYKLAIELMDAAKNQGAAIKKRDDTLRMAEANRAFAHFRW